MRRGPAAGASHVLVYLVVLVALMLLAQLSLVASRVPVHIVLTATAAAATLDGKTLTLPLSAQPTALQFVPVAPTTREFQIDGTDSANNFTEDPRYFAWLMGSPYYAFQTWMRASERYSSWHGVTAQGFADGGATTRRTLPDGQVTLSLPPGSRVVIDTALERPEVPVDIDVLCGATTCAQLEIDRNDRYVTLQTPNSSDPQARRAYFPQQVGPFLAQVLYLIFQIGIWSLLVFGVATIVTLGLTLLIQALGPTAADVAQVTAAMGARIQVAVSRGALQVRSRVRAALDRARTAFDRIRGQLPQLPGDRWDALAVAVTLASFGWTLYVSRVLFAGEPHLLDASSYFFQAKIFASGRLSVPAPLLPDAFKGPFMVLDGGRWFGIYPPATCALLAIGILLHAPWAVEPLLGSLALWGIYRIGRRLFGPPTGALALLLGALSPFYTFLAASYMSHAVALCFSVYFLLALLRFSGAHRTRDLVLAALAAGGLVLTRELTSALMIVLAVGYIGAVSWRRLWADRERVVVALLAALPIVCLAVLADVVYNWLQTGDPYLPPRLAFDPTAQYGFGPGIGFYGQHTLAAGLVNLDQLLTALLIDLYGWPFYLTLTFVALAFLLGSSFRRWDLLCVLGFAVPALAQVGYFYHGIYLGPRYLYETLPFLLLLTARGILALPSLAGRACESLLPAVSRTSAYASGRVMTAALLLALVGCNLLYYLPRQVELANGFTGLPYRKPVDAAAIYAFHAHNAIVLTSDWFIYSYILFPLNDPDLRGATLYAYAPASETEDTLRATYPNRTLYLLQVEPSGKVVFTPLPR
jgi:hypothetical protein